MVKKIVAMCCLLLFASGYIELPVAAKGVDHIESFDQFELYVLKSKVPVIVDF